MRKRSKRAEGEPKDDALGPPGRGAERQGIVETENTATRSPVCISYLRFSSTAQTGGSSIARQLEQSERWAKEHGLTIDKTLSGRDEAKSAFKGDNIELGAFAGILRHIKSGRIPPGSTLIVESLDRISRLPSRRALRVFLQIIDEGRVTIVTLVDGKVYVPDSTESMDLIGSILIMQRAHEESLTKSHRAKDNWTRRRKIAAEGKAILTTKLHAWLRIDNGKIVVDKAKAKTVRYVFDLALKGLGVGSIVRRLNSEMVPPLSPPRKANDACWHARFVYCLLTEGAALGRKHLKTFEGKKRVVVDTVDNYYPRVISDETFDRVKSLIASRRNREYRSSTAKHCNIFAGILKDDHGNSFSTFSRKGADVRYLVSLSWYSKKLPNVPAIYLRQDLFEAAFFETLIGEFPQLIADQRDVGSQQHELLSMMNEREDVGLRLSEVETALADGTGSVDVLARASAKLEQKRLDLDKAITQLKSSQIWSGGEEIEREMDRLRDLVYGSADMSNDERIEIAATVRQLVKRIEIKLSNDGGGVSGVGFIEAVDGRRVPLNFSYPNLTRGLPSADRRTAARSSLVVNGEHLNGELA